MLSKVRSVVVGMGSRNSASDDCIEVAEEGQVAVEQATNSTASASFYPQKVAMVVDMSDSSWFPGILPGAETPRFPYCRPEFLYFSEDEIAVSSDQRSRPVIVPKDPYRMPVFAGYAEVINAGKTDKNEDQAAARMLNLVQTGHEKKWNGTGEGSKKASRQRASSECRYSQSPAEGDSLCRRLSDDELLINVPPDRAALSMTESGSCIARAEAAYFAVFDGHAGSGAAIMAANCLHEHIRNRLCQVVETVLYMDRQEQMLNYKKTKAGNIAAVSSPNGKQLTSDSLVVGALETAFVDMDEQISEEKVLWRISGGSAALVLLIFLGKIYAANAGDCRAVLVSTSCVRTLTRDFTPDSERKRLQHLAYKQPDLIGLYFTRLEYSRYLTRKDLKKKVLYRDWYMDGWAAKSVRESDLKPSLISDGIRKRRLLNTIGVSRGFGDHHLMTVDDRIPIKPFLTPVPEVQVFDMHTLDTLTETDVVILASDGLWDVLSNDEAAAIVISTLSQPEMDDCTRYTVAAQDLVIAARGLVQDGRRWQSSDDITAFVIPLKYAMAPPSIDEDDVELLQ